MVTWQESTRGLFVGAAITQIEGGPADLEKAEGELFPSGARQDDSR